MAILFSSIEEFRAFVSGAVDNDEAMLENIESDINAAINEHLRPWVGDVLIDAMIDAYPDSAEPLSTLTQKVQEVVAPLALYHASFTKNIRFNTSGLVRPESVPFRYQEADMREEFLTRGYESLELLLKYLDANTTHFPTWDKKNKHRSLFLKYASEFRDASSFRISRWTFENIRAIIDDVEFYVIEKLLPQAFFNRLKNSTTLQVKELEAIRLIQKVVANFTIEEAVRRNRVMISGGSVFNTEKVRDQSSTTYLSANSENIERTATFQNLAADRNVARLRAFLEANITDFPLCFHADAGGSNTDGDAWGYLPPPPSDTELKVMADNLWKDRWRSVVSL